MESIKRLFAFNNIKYIVSVDDCYEDFNFVDDFSLLENIVNEPSAYINIMKSIKLENEYESLMNLPKELFRLKFEHEFYKFSDEDKKVLSQVGTSNNTILTDEKELLLSFFNKLKEQEIIIDYKTFENIQIAKTFLNEEIQGIWNPSEEKKILWFVDREIKDRKDAGFDLLSELCSNKFEFNVGILATQNTSDISNEDDFDKILDNTLNVPKENKNLVWVINKNLIDTNYVDELVEKISHGLRRNYTYKITNFLTASFQDGIKISSENFKNIKQSTINKMILKFSTAEGTSMIDTLTRVLMAITKNEMNKKIYESFDNISKMLDNYEKLCEDLVEKSTDNLEEVYRFRNNEKYNMLVNEHYYPIGFGDIFIIDQESYILISQPCDIQIRGDKGKRNLQYATLLKMTIREPSHKEYGILDYYEKIERYFVSFKDPISIEFSILDLCSLNSNGEAKVSVVQLGEPMYKPYRYTTGQRKRLEQVLKQVNTIYSERKIINEKFKEIRDYILKVETDDKSEIHLLLEDYNKINNKHRESMVSLDSYLVDENNLNYPVCRKGRLEENYTTKLMLDYGAHISRIGLPGDYGSDFKHTQFTILMNSSDVFFDSSISMNILEEQINILLDDITVDGNKIKQQVFRELYEGKYNGKIEERIRDNMDSFINVDINSRKIYLAWEYLIEEGNNFLDVTKKIVYIEREMLILQAPKFLEFLTKIEGKTDLIKHYKLYTFYDQQGNLNNKFSFKSSNFKNNLFSIEVEGEVVLTIEFIISFIKDTFFNIELSLKENDTSIDKLFTLLEEKILS